MNECHLALALGQLTRLRAPEALIAVDAGNDTCSCSRCFETQGQRVRMSGDLGSIGFSPCAMEFTTRVRPCMDITPILLNNAQLGKMAKEQRAGEWPLSGR